LFYLFYMNLLLGFREILFELSQLDVIFYKLSSLIGPYAHVELKSIFFYLSPSLGILTYSSSKEANYLGYWWYPGLCVYLIFWGYLSF